MMITKTKKMKNKIINKNNIKKDLIIINVFKIMMVIINRLFKKNKKG